MLTENSHLTDQQLLLAADGELPVRRAAQVRAHLAACWGCRARMAEIEGTIADFARTHRQTLDPKLPAIAGSRSQLRAQLAHLAAKPHSDSWRRFFQFTPGARVAAYICVGLFIAAIGGKRLVQHFTLRAPDSAVISFEPEVVPNPSLTPGAARQVTAGEVCVMAHEEVVKTVPESLRREVFQEYGIVNPQADDYEIDYLIAPGLGGTENIHNLWPEPYTSPTWNAHVKDALEERLHQLVCSGKLSLSAAQHAIATNWIAAYKKYVSTDKPFALSSNPIRPFRMGAFQLNRPYSLLELSTVLDFHHPQITPWLEMYGNRDHRFAE